MAALEHFWAVVPAGGAGTRLWPLSRSAAPKFLQDLSGQGRSLLQQACDRLTPLAGAQVLVVTGREHRDAVLAQLPQLAPESVIAEPSPRDSMAAIGLAAALLEVHDPDAVLGSFAADHVIADHEAFAAAVRRAVQAARHDWLVTIGITPTGPSTAFGYLRVGDELPDLPGTFVVREFVEKPGAETAATYVASGEYRWNAGMFVARPGVLLDLLALEHPQFAASLRDIARETTMRDIVRDASLLAHGWDHLPRIALDHAVAEPAAAAGRVAVVPGDFGWDDIGDFDSLAALLPDTRSGVAVLGDPELVRLLRASGLVVTGSGRTVAVVGVDDIVVVDTPDAVLVTTRAHAQAVKQLVAELKDERPDLT